MKYKVKGIRVINTILCDVLGFLLLVCSGFACGEIIVDNKFNGHESPILPNKGTMTIDQSLGQIRGGNLFHSFKVFDINKGQTATFTGSNTLKNVISRVTGGGISHINGKLESQVGHAAFYFINPNGVVFGEGAKVDVPGAFHVSTADAIKFADNKVFSATNPGNASLLTASSLESFGFLDHHPATLSLDGAKLAFKQNQKASFLGGNLKVNNSNIIVEGGEIRLGAVGMGHKQVNLNTIVGNNPRNMQFEGSANIGNSRILVNGDGGGKLVVQAGNLAVRDHSLLSAANTGSRNSNINQGIRMGVRDTLKVTQSKIESSTNNIAKAGDIIVSAGNIYVDGKGEEADIGSYSRTNNSSSGEGGHAGNINVTAEDKLVLLDGGYINSISETNGNSSNITVNANTITIDANNIKDNDKKDKTAGIHTQNTCTKTLCNDGHKNKSGSVNVTASGDIKLLNNGSIESTTNGYKDAGGVVIQAKNMLIDGNGYSSGVFSDTVCFNDNDCPKKPKGNAGTVDVNITEKLTMRNYAKISSVTGDFSTGNANNITVMANNIHIDGLDRNVGEKDQITGILSTTYAGSHGNSGSIFVTAKKNLTLLNRGQISTETFTNGNAGKITVNANTIHMDGKGTVISSAATCDKALCGVGDLYVKGNAGKIDVLAKNELLLANQAAISTASSYYGKAGSIFIKVGKLAMHDGAYLSTTAAYNNGGNITLRNGITELDNSNITTEVENNGSGGFIDLKSQITHFNNNSKLTTSVENGAGNGGNIDLKGQIAVLNRAVIQANAKSGKGGEIHVIPNILLVSHGQLHVGRGNNNGLPPENLIQAVSEKGEAVAKFTNPELNINGQMIPLRSGFLSSPDLSDTACTKNKGSSLIQSGKGGLPRTPETGLYVPSLSTVNVSKNIGSQNASSKSYAPCL